MKTFTYTAKDMNGSIIKSSMQCEDYNEFLSKIQERGLFCMSHKELDSTVSKRLHKFNTRELAFNCRQLSAMMSSGLSLVKALDILAKEQDKEAARIIWRDIYEDVQKGQAFSEALLIQRGAFPDFLISMIKAGESSGSLDAVMIRMADHYAKENKMFNKIKGSLTYPIVLACLSICVVIGMALFILPAFMEMFKGATLPPLTQFLFNMIDNLKKFWYIHVGIIVGLVFLIRYLLKIPDIRLKWDRFIIKGPGFGPLVIKIYTGRFARTMASLYSSGIPMIECLERSSKILGNSYIDKLFETVVDEVKQGEPLSMSIQRTGIFDSMFCSIILVGEESGALDDILTKSSEYYEDEADTALQKLVTMVEPLMIIFMGAAIAFVMVAIFPALYSMYQNIG